MILSEVFPNVLTTGAVLTTLNNKYPEFIADLHLDSNDITSFDIEYIYKSGKKPISNLLKGITDVNRITLVMDNNDRLVVDNYANLIGVKGLIMLDYNTLANVLYSIYKVKWVKQANSYYLNYDLLSPFNIKVTDTNEESRSSNNTNNSSSDDTYSSNSNSSTERKVSAFNSNVYEPNDNVVDETTNSNSSNRSSTWGGTNESTGSSNRETIRVGNIGNRTSQELIEAERKLYQQTLFDYIRKDLDKVLTLPIYKEFF